MAAWRFIRKAILLLLAVLFAARVAEAYAASGGKAEPTKCVAWRRVAGSLATCSEPEDRMLATED